MKINRTGFPKQCLWLLAAVFLLTAASCGDSKQVKKEQELREAGLQQLNQGDYEGALDTFNQALKERVGIVSNLEEDINFYKAYAQVELGQTEEAADTYTALIEYDKKNADAYYLRGCAYISMGDTKLAVDDFKKAAEYKKDSGELYAGIYVQLMSVGLSKEASSYLEKGIEMNGDSAAACLTRGRLYLAAEDYNNAEIELKDALAKDEIQADLYLGDAAKMQGRSEEAQAYYEAYAEKYPEDPKVLLALGQIAFETEDYSQALSYFEKGLEGGSILFKRDLWSGKISALEHMSEFETALAEMEEYLKSYPQDARAQREYTFLKTR